MNFYLLDAAAPGLIVGVMIIFMLIIIVLEAVTMLIMKYNKAGKAFLDSLLINLVSMGAGFLILLLGVGKLGIIGNAYINLLALFAITVLVEFAVLFLLNRRIPIRKTLLAAVIINIISYLFYYLIEYVF